MKDKLMITKTINNNISFSRDERGNEIIVFGKGISFGKKAGDTIDLADVLKTFELKDTRQKSIFTQMVESIDPLYIDIAAKIVDLFEKELETRLNPMMMITLSDHISNAIDNYRQGITTPNEMLNEIKRIYPKEYGIAKKGLEIIRQDTGVLLDHQEAGFIVLHYVNSTDKAIRTDAGERIRLVNKIVTIVETYFQIRIDEDSYYGTRFVTHLTFLASRIFANVKLDSQDDFVYRMIGIQYPEIKKCVNIIEAFVQEDFHKKITDEEKGYLLIHIKALLQTRGGS